jgi:hypothetical protein
MKSFGPIRKYGGKTSKIIVSLHAVELGCSYKKL